jgi:SSS family solute:Na+ symporter
MRIHFADYLIIASYFGAVIVVGLLLRRRPKTGTEFFLSGRALPAWITGLAFMSANLGSLEVMGHAANAAKYGMVAAGAFYWLGAIPAMIFLGIFMMPFYYGNRVRSSPEYLKLRFDERARGFNAVGFAVVTILMSGINMYAMALIFKIFLDWPMDVSIWASAGTVMLYILFGGLRAAIYNEVIQFFLIFLGLLPLSFMGLNEVGWWQGLSQQLPAEYVHAYSVLGQPDQNPMGVPWYSIVMAFTVFGGVSYWCTDFLIVQRALAARNMLAARQTPLIAAFFKMLTPSVVILPGLLALAVIPDQIEGQYNMAVPLLLQRYYPAGLLGLGLTALLASFMSGMAGNVTAFNTVWTYDIYQAYLRPNRSDRHYVWMGRLATVVGTVLSVGTSYLVMRFANMGDYLVLIFSLFMYPMAIPFLCGMFTKRTSPTGAFCGMVAGVAAGLLNYVLYHFGIIQYQSDMAANIYVTIGACLVGLLVTIGVSLFTQRRPDSELEGLVYSFAHVFRGDVISWHQNPVVLGIALLAMLGGLAVFFW